LLGMKVNKEFSQFKKEILFLDKYYLEPRYPIDQPKAYTKKEAETALEIASRIINFIKKAIR